MNNKYPMEKEDVYRLLDALYRIHEDLFHVEDEISRFASASFAIRKVQSNSFMGALTAGFLVVIPILVAILDIKWSSAPAVTIFIIAVGVIVIWIYQALSTRSAEGKLGFIAGQSFRTPLERRRDYLQEIIASWGTRKRMIDEIITELKIHLTKLSNNDDEYNDVKQRLTRYHSISEQCIEWIKWAVDTSEECLKEGQRSQEEHEEILDWAKPFINQ